MRRELAPKSTYRSYFTDSTRWETYTPRPGDIVIATPPKVGTTWTQRITSVLVFQEPRLPASLMDISPWLDCAFIPLDGMLETLERQQHRRFIKTHLPMDALPVHDDVSYLVVGRDLRDAAVSTHNHALGINGILEHFPPGPRGDDVHTPEQPTVTDDIHEFWRDYFTRSAFPWETNGWPYNSPTRHLETWWEHRDRPNVLFLHYQDMLDDLDKEMRRVSAFLGIPVDETVWPGLVQACTFSDMKSHQEELFAEELAAHLSTFQFLHQGRNGQWHDMFSAEELALHRAAMDGLPGDLRAWLERSA